MKTYLIKSNLHLTTWILATTILVLVVTVTLIVAMYPATHDPQVHQPANAQPIPAPTTNSTQVVCQDLPECGYIQMHADEQNLTGSGPVGQASAPVLTPACDRLPECAYIRPGYSGNG